jgi:hypothetical protein
MVFPEEVRTQKYEGRKDSSRGLRNDEGLGPRAWRQVSHAGDDGERDDDAVVGAVHEVADLDWRPLAQAATAAG